MKRVLFFVFLVALVGCGQKSTNDIAGDSDTKTLKIACAANMQYAMDSIIVLFKKEYAVSCEITSGSSGMLTSQIENGAPYDIFISANMTYPETIHKNGNGAEPIIYAKGRLVFVTEKNQHYQSVDEALASTSMERIAVADDKTAPYGMAAQQYLKRTNRKQNLADKLVIGESIGQVNQYITTAAVNGAFTSYSFKVKNESAYDYFEINQEHFDPINQGAMILNHGLNNCPEESEQFLNFLVSSAKCKAVLDYFGYLTN